MKIHAAAEDGFYEKLVAEYEELKLQKEYLQDCISKLVKHSKAAIKITQDNYSWCIDNYCEGYCQGCEVQRAQSEVIEILESAIPEWKRE